MQVWMLCDNIQTNKKYIFCKIYFIKKNYKYKYFIPGVRIKISHSHDMAPEKKLKPFVIISLITKLH